MYLECISGSKKDKNELSLNKLNIFNNTLNLVSQNYFNNVTREYAEKTKLEDIEKFVFNGGIQKENRYSFIVVTVLLSENKIRRSPKKVRGDI